MTVTATQAIVEKLTERHTKKPWPSKNGKQFSPTKVHAMKFKWVGFAYSKSLSFNNPNLEEKAFLFAISEGGLF